MDSTATTKSIIAKFQKSNPTSFHRATIYKKLKDMGYCRRALRKGVIIHAPNLLKQRKWAKSQLRWEVSDWLGHILSDETSVQIESKKKVDV